MPQLLGCQKHRFSIPDGVTYLNSATMGPLPTASVEAGIEALRRRATPITLTPRDFFEPAEQARTLCAKLVNADPERVALVSTASAGLSVAARNITPRTGGNVVVLAEQFPSNVYPWRNWARAGVELRTVAAPVPPSADSTSLRQRALRWNEALVDAIDSRTFLVAIEQAHWTDGTLFDLERIGKRCRAVGAAFVVDATQTVGAMPLDMQAIQPDLLVVHSYKSMLANYGLGFIVLSDRFGNGIPNDESWLTREGSEDFAGLVDYRDNYAAGMRRFDTSTRASPVLIDVLKASAGLLVEWQPARIRDYLLDIERAAVERLRGHGFGVLDEELRAANLFGIVLPPRWNPEACRASLAERGILVSVRGSSVRVSPHVHCDEHDLARLADALIGMSSI